MQCLSESEQWKNLRSFAVLESERSIGDTVTRELRLYISSLGADAKRLASTIRSHWSVENRLHWVMDVMVQR